MSSFVVSTDHIDYLVSAAYAFAPDAPGIRNRDPQALGMLLLRENVATVRGRPWPDDPAADPFDDLPGDIVWGVPEDPLDDLEFHDYGEFDEYLRGVMESYVHRPVRELDAAQTVSVAVCWQYQRNRSYSAHNPESWVIAETVKDRALAAMADDDFIDPGAARSFDNMAGREAIPWVWSRSTAEPEEAKAAPGGESRQLVPGSSQSGHPIRTPTPGRIVVASDPPVVLGLVQLRVRSAGRSETTIQLLLEGEEGVAPCRWDTLLAAPELPVRTVVVGPSGRKLLGLLPSAASQKALGGAVERLVMVDVSTGAVTEINEEERGPRQRLDYALSADDSALALSLMDWTEPGRLVVTVLRGPNLQDRVERAFPGAGAGMRGSVDRLLQWSPDGRYLALQLREPHPRWGRKTYDSLLVLDAHTLQTVLAKDLTWLMGSLSWSAESDRLAVLDFDEPRILHLDDERLEPLPWLRASRGAPPRQAQILGLLGGDRAVVLRQSQSRVRLVIADLATGKGPVAAAFPIDEMDWPVEMTISRGWERFL